MTPEPKEEKKEEEPLIITPKKEFNDDFFLYLCEDAANEIEDKEE